MKKWSEYSITNKFDNSGILISWDGIKKKDAEKEVKELAIKNGKLITDYIIIKTN